MSLNICGVSNDQFYRYKMPAMVTSVQRKCGGTTVVENALQICESINRDPTIIAKWMSRELKQPVQYKNQSWHFKGTFSQRELQEKLQIYINNNVLCSLCGNPETVIVRSKMKCASCGGSTEL